MKKTAPNNIPQHIAIIPDGNRRWAKSKHLPSVFGHKKSVDQAEDICLRALDRGVKVVTMWGFSTKNWRRPKTEVRYLMGLFEDIFTNKAERLHKHGVRMRVSGRIEELPAKLRSAIHKAEELTAGNKRGTLHICLNYSGRAEILDIAKKIAAQHIKPSDITERTIEKQLYVPDLPPVDMIIRTSGEYRLSGFLPWQAEDAEYLFLEKHWPAFTPDDMDKAIAEYQRRQRRFGA